MKDFTMRGYHVSKDLESIYKNRLCPDFESEPNAEDIFKIKNEYDNLKERISMSVEITVCYDKPGVKCKSKNQTEALL